MVFKFISTQEQLQNALINLVTEDAVCLPLLPRQDLADLIAAAEMLSYRTSQSEVGSGSNIVKQNFEICMFPPKLSIFWDLGRELEQLLHEVLGKLALPLLLERFQINDIVVQRYAAGSSGISANRDHLKYRGLVCLILLSGTGQFFICKDRLQSKKSEILWTPGSILFMRAPGLANHDERPFHYLVDIRTERYSIGLRYNSQLEKEFV